MNFDMKVQKYKYKTPERNNKKYPTRLGIKHIWRNNYKQLLDEWLSEYVQKFGKSKNVCGESGTGCI